MSKKSESTGDKVKKSLGLDSELSGAQAAGLKSRTPRDQLTAEERKKRDDEDNAATAAAAGAAATAAAASSIVT